MDFFAKIKEEMPGDVDDEESEGEEAKDIFDEASVGSLTVADITDPEELKRQLKEYVVIIMKK
jgi:hypothetical protein